MGRIQQLPMSELADCALLSICPENSLAKVPLMESLLSNSGDVLASGGYISLAHGIVRTAKRARIVDNNFKRQRLRVVAHNVHWPRSFILSWDDPVEIHERDLVAHCSAESDVVGVLRISPAVSVA